MNEVFNFKHLKCLVKKNNHQTDRTYSNLSFPFQIILESDKGKIGTKTPNT